MLLALRFLLEVLAEVSDLAHRTPDRVGSVLRVRHPFFYEHHEEALDRLNSVTSCHEEQSCVRDQAATLVVRHILPGRHVQEVESPTFRDDELFLKIEDLLILSRGDDLKGAVGLVYAFE